MSAKTYNIQITYLRTGVSEMFELQTHDIEWAMDQYQRNRDPFTWEILD